jgi:UDP-N-acetylglucosamine--N-acetylmuramyl-(pentapeptide) pyrophosphoryl-undecaprenol N-acetylglucosamine transferase
MLLPDCHTAEPNRRCEEGMKIYLAAFGSGMGHASRMAAIADRLVTSGHDVMFSSSGEVTKWLQAKGYPCNDIPLVDVVFTGAGNFSATDTLKYFPLITARFYRQIEREVANLRLFRPDVVLSDTMISTIVASRLLGIRSVAILNQLKLVSSPKTPKTIAKLLSGASMTVGNALWELCDEILVPDLPPPYTISEQNLWQAGSASDRARYIGFLTPDGVKDETAEEKEEDDFLTAWLSEKRKRRVFWQISGPPATRSSFLAKALAVAKELEDDYLFVITAGNPVGGTTPMVIRGGYLYQWCKRSSAFIDSCDTVVSRAGHVSISDYVLRAKPSLLVPIQAQSEQIGNADKAKRLGVALAIEEHELCPQKVGEVLGTLSDGEYSDRLLELRKLAEEYDALSSILDVVGAN